MTRVRPFAPTDYPAFVEGSNRCYPEYRWTVEEARHHDDHWDHAHFLKVRLVAEEDGALVGAVDVNHSRGWFHPHKYRMDLWVVPERRRRGNGSALYDAALSLLRQRGAIAARANTKESMTDGVAFLAKRGWVELKRDWESRLHVRGFNFARFAGAEERVKAQGIRVTTYADEARADPVGAPRRAYELVEACRADVPTPDPVTPVDFEHFRADTLDAPTALHEAFFIAVGPDGRWLGLSNMFTSLDDPTFLWQGLTGTRREERGRGIAMALKLRTVRYALDRAVEHIKTWNDTRNRPMLSINEALGFEKQPPWITFEKQLSGPAP